MRHASTRHALTVLLGLACTAGVGLIAWGAADGPPATAAPHSFAARQALDRYAQARHDAQAAYNRTMEQATQKLVTALEAAKQQAMRGGDLKEANAINAAMIQAKGGIAAPDEQGPLSSDAVAAQRWFNYKFGNNPGTRVMELRPDRTIGRGAAKFERRWDVQGDCIVISGSGGDMLLHPCKDGAFRGMMPKTGEEGVLSPAREK